MVRAAAKPVGTSQATAKWGMWAVSAMGVGGVAFHAYGVARMMGRAATPARAMIRVMSALS
ncbi:hypothetical protein MMSR116_30980 [Methylobacterium mesophilicum SR1.6/6]|uniref:Uncharacterized protein n=1 Tax=Methylobacterium mesophilicum SR1.6/6 TaxID=908290 RepID=A0A6B9FVS0_9HYPH|nr:hypothetical protein MMSR116_30980 [Methylobacterium mesophilicum SR1.6/6]